MLARPGLWPEPEKQEIRRTGLIRVAVLRVQLICLPGVWVPTYN
jgi:hypothetical protein